MARRRINCLSAVAVIAGCLGGLGSDAGAGTTVFAALAQAGLTPDAVVAADLQEHATKIVASIEAATDIRQALDPAQAEVDTKAALLTSLGEKMSQSTGDEGLEAEYDAVAAQLAQARAQVELLRAELFERATDGLPPAKIDTLLVWHESVTYRVPAEFRVLKKSPEDWSLIESAVRAEQRSIRRGEQVSSDYADLLTEIRSTPEVVAASQRMTIHLPTVKEAFGDVMHEE